MSDLEEAAAVLIPLLVLVFGVLSIRAWKRDRRVTQLVGGIFAILYAPTTILNLALMGNACGTFLFAKDGYGPRSVLVDSVGKAFLLLAALAWATDAVRRSAGSGEVASSAEPIAASARPAASLPLGRRILLAWGPALLVLVAEVLAFVCFSMPKSRLEFFAFHAALVVALVITAPSWLKAGSGRSYLLATAIKLALFAATTTRATFKLWATASDVLLDPAHQDIFIHYGALPLALVLVTAVEGWGIWVLLAGRRFPRWALYPLIAVAALAVTAPVAWRMERMSYYLARIRSGDIGAELALADVGPSALPPVERAIRALGAGPAGSRRKHLVRAMVRVRDAVVAGRLGKEKLQHPELAQVGADPGVRDTLVAALVAAPGDEERTELAEQMGDVDFDTGAQALCAALPRVPPAREAPLVGEFERLVRAAHWTPGARGTFGGEDPWRGMPAAEVKAQEHEMRGKLACAVPAVITLLERGVSNSNSSWPGGTQDAIRALAGLRPLAPALSTRLRAMALRTKNDRFLLALLDTMGVELTNGNVHSLCALMAAVYQRSKDALLRTELRQRVAAERNHVDPEEFFCDVFHKHEPTWENAYERYPLFGMVKNGTNPCVATELMAGYVPGKGSWHAAALDVLSARSSRDPRIAPWARKLAKGAKDAREKRRLEALAGGAPQEAHR